MSISVIAESYHASHEVLTDIVAIHDFFQPSGSSSQAPHIYFSWLRDHFRYQRLRCRVLLYSYDARALLKPGSSSDLDLFTQATTLVNSLVADRQNAGADLRPIVFLCHGFGGLLLQRALALTSESNSTPVAFQTLRSSTCAIIFAGTPHRGINYEALNVLYERSSNPPNQFMLDLLQGSDILHEISSLFRPLLTEVRTINFWEQIPTVSGKASAFIVGEQSAAPMLYSMERDGLMSDHASLLTFSGPGDTGFKKVDSALESCVQDSTRRHQHKAAEKFVETTSPRRLAQGQSQGHNMWQNEITGRAVHLGDVYVYNTIESDLSSRQLEAAPIPSRLNMYGKVAKSGCQMYKVERRSSAQFTGRRMQTAILSEKLAAPKRAEHSDRHKVAVIYGLGGSGKTQFCLRFAELHQANYWGVFWIDASTQVNAEAGYAAIGFEVGKGATASAGKFWLSQCEEPWLLILDNADEPEMDLSDLIPTGNKGHILITTRNPNVIIHSNAGALRFRGMDPEDGIELLLKSAYPLDEPDRKEPQKRSMAGSIAAELGYLAIALDLAGGTIRKKIWTLERYLHFYLGHRHRFLKSKSALVAPEETNVVTTWEVPFRRIESRSTVEYQDAVALLHIFAFLHFESVSEDLFFAFWMSTEENTSEMPDLLQLNSKDIEIAQSRLKQAIGVLYDHSIIDQDSSRSTCALHPVVHRWARTRITASGQNAFWLHCTAQLLTRCISPHLEASGHKFRRELLPHVDYCVELLRAHDPSFPSTANDAMQMESFALLYSDNGRWTQAIGLQKGVVSFRLRYLGRFHEDTLRAQRALSYSLWNLFQVKQVIDIQYVLLFRRWWLRPSLSDWIRRLKPDHISYCIALDDLAQSLWLAGQRQWSKRAGERALGGLMRRLGPDDPLTLNAMFNLGRTYHHLGETAESHSLLVMVLRKRRLFFGTEHPLTLMARNELGMNFYARKCHLAAAERLVSSVIEARKRVLGEEHAYTLWSINDLSKILCERGRPGEAAEKLEAIIPTVVRTLGQDHVGMTMTKGNLARAYVKAERWTAAEGLLKDMLDVVGEEHPDWLDTMYGFVHVKVKLGKLKEAESNYDTIVRVLNGKKDVQDPVQKAMVERLRGQIDEKSQLH